MSELGIAFGLTVLAGMATGIGSTIAFLVPRTNFRFLSLATGFSAGVMLYVSFVEILPEGETVLAGVYGSTWGSWINAAAFFGGIALIGLIDSLVPSAENPHEIHSEGEIALLRRAPAIHSDPDAKGPTAVASDLSRKPLLRMALFTALAITIHNFPEGLATFLAALEDPSLGVAIAVAIAFHNIPEGISVSVPIFYATGNRRQAFVYSLLSGLAEPLGAGVAYLSLRFILGGDSGVLAPQVMGVLFSGVAGVMVYISLDELLPTSRAYGRGHDTILGLLAGMVLMALSLLMMQ